MIPIAHGRYLSRIAEAFGIRRGLFESDKHLRARCQNIIEMFNVDNPNKVMHGLSHCQTGICAPSCPYHEIKRNKKMYPPNRQCVNVLMRDALVLLEKYMKEEEQHVLG